jgi:hypothetical protein
MRCDKGMRGNAEKSKLRKTRGVSAEKERKDRKIRTRETMK